MQIHFLRDVFVAVAVVVLPETTRKVEFHLLSDQNLRKRFVNGKPSTYLRLARYTSLPLDFKTLFPGQTLHEKLESRLPLAADRLIILNLQTGDADQSFN